MTLTRDTTTYHVTIKVNLQLTWSKLICLSNVTTLKLCWNKFQNWYFSVKTSCYWIFKILKLRRFSKALTVIQSIFNHHVSKFKFLERSCLKLALKPNFCLIEIQWNKSHACDFKGWYFLNMVTWQPPPSHDSLY